MRQEGFVCLTLVLSNSLSHSAHGYDFHLHSTFDIQHISIDIHPLSDGIQYSIRRFLHIISDLSTILVLTAAWLQVGGFPYPHLTKNDQICRH